MAVYIAWKCKRELAQVQVQIQALDLWKQYNPNKNDDSKEAEESLNRRTAYLLKQSYIDTIVWGMAGIAILGSLVSTLGSIV